MPKTKTKEATPLTKIKFCLFTFFCSSLTLDISTLISTLLGFFTLLIFISSELIRTNLKHKNLRFTRLEMSNLG